MTEKRGFVLYFDTLDSIAALGAEQRGTLLLALFRYAIAVSERDENPLDFLHHETELEPDAQMAFCFMASAIRRDTRKWLARRQHYRDAAAQRTAGAPPLPSATTKTPTMKQYLEGK